MPTQPVPRAVDNSADYFEELQKGWQKEYDETAGMLYASAMVSGHPPLTEANSEIGMWQSLNLMRSTGDPRFWQDPEAQAMYAQLAQKYGSQRPPVPAVPLGVMNGIT